ncbi:VWA domain-containing protein [Clostridium sp. YIM B02505]|uniref:VWA domain-containing protein n=1 Tax=Clostridium yunnanense TaxID=2800325 RepID=A0ABS1EJ38_9CLOT|nr:VIT domain-containing protein [Clostridium yunnanense]MBK1809379.1 VWA domain-containing protein [Clostridium yunnanense]
MMSLSDVTVERLSINGHICGEFVEFTLSQSFKNNTGKTIDGEYAFPMTETGVLTGLEVRVGDRILESVVEGKADVEKIYNDALLDGINPLKLESYENNLYKLTIKDILPSELVKIKVSYMDHMPYEDDGYSLVLPKIMTNGVIPNKFYFSIIVKSMGEMLIESASHKINIEREDETLCKITLEDGELLDRDFVLDLTEKCPIEASGMYYTVDEEKEESILYLSIFPKLDEEIDDSGNNYMFILDKSNSMMGEKLEQGKNALQLCLRNLDDNDTFNIIAFDEEILTFSEQGKVPYNQENLRKASEFINSLSPSSEEENLIEALKIALNEKNKQGDSTILLFTDDNVEDEEEDIILNYVKENIGDNRIFPFGMDTSVNSYFINRIAEIGYGKPEFIYYDEKIEDLVVRQFSRINSPQIDVLKIDWGNLEVLRTYPRSIEYLYDREQFSIFALVKGAIEGDIRIIGKVGEEDYSVTINMDSFDLEENVDLIRKAWSRMRIESISERMRGERGESAESMRNKIIEISKESGILSEETELLMVESFQEPVLGATIRKTVPLIVSEEALKDFTSGYFIDSPRFLYNTSEKLNKSKPKVEESKEITRDQLLKLIARNQFAEGSFDNSEESTLYDRIENTCLSLIAFGLGKEDLNLYNKQIDKGIKYVARTLTDVEELLDENLCILTLCTFKAVEKKGLLRSKTEQDVVEAVNVIKDVIKYNEYAALEGLMKLNRFDIITEIAISFITSEAIENEQLFENMQYDLKGNIRDAAKYAILRLM